VSRLLPALLLVICGTTIVALSSGCDSRPRAPALRDSAVYQNRSAGLRFLVPQGWTQVASSVLPSGELTSEFMLVKYQMRTTAQGATLELLCFDDSASSDLVAYHAQASHGIAEWKRVGEPVEVTQTGVAGQRAEYHGNVAKSMMHKDVTVFRRGRRVFSFVGLYWQDDQAAREEIRRAVDSLAFQ
jgi:predicted Zn-dependent protease